MAIAATPPWWFWRFLLRRFSWLVGIFGRIEVTGQIPEDLRRGPLLLAANHIGDFDPFVVAVALHRVGVVPRIMATGGIMSAPVVGPLLERTGGRRRDHAGPRPAARRRSGAAGLRRPHPAHDGRRRLPRRRGPGRRPVSASVRPHGGH